MFTLQTRISDALAARPALREILPAFHPAFAKLTHPILGKILPRLVNVADAARVAGVDAQTLLDVMNLPGLPAAPAIPVERGPDAPPPGWLRDPLILDVRPDFLAGREPFARIMGALRELAPGQPLTVLAPFEPAPLIRLLEGRGWSSHVAFEGDVCRASFGRGPTDLAERAGPPVAIEHTADGARIDVRGLEPPEPMRRVLDALDRPDALPLTVIHDREPVLLYPRLTERGLGWSVARVGDHFEIRIG